MEAIIYTYDIERGLRFRINELVEDLDSAERTIFLTKMQTTVAGWQIKEDDTVIKEWWDRRARKYYATGVDSVYEWNEKDGE